METQYILSTKSRSQRQHLIELFRDILYKNKKVKSISTLNLYKTELKVILGDNNAN